MADRVMRRGMARKTMLMMMMMMMIPGGLLIIGVPGVGLDGLARDQASTETDEQTDGQTDPLWATIKRAGVTGACTQEACLPISIAPTDCSSARPPALRPHAESAKASSNPATEGTGNGRASNCSERERAATAAGFSNPQQGASTICNSGRNNRDVEQRLRKQ